MIQIRQLALSLALTCTAALSGDVPGNSIRLNLRTRVEAFKGSGDWQEVHFQKTLPAGRTAIVICDMWDKHWCSGASHRVDALARRMAPVIDAARAHGIQIIHAPSEVMDFYKEAPQRLRAVALAKIDPPSPLGLTAPSLPIDDSGGGCDTGDSFYKAWNREIATLHIAPGDLISDNGSEIY